MCPFNTSVVNVACDVAVFLSEIHHLKKKKISLNYLKENVTTIYSANLTSCPSK